MIEFMLVVIAFFLYLIADNTEKILKALKPGEIEESE